MPLPPSLPSVMFVRQPWPLRLIPRPFSRASRPSDIHPAIGSATHRPLSRAVHWPLTPAVQPAFPPVETPGLPRRAAHRECLPGVTRAA